LTCPTSATDMKIFGIAGPQDLVLKAALIAAACMIDSPRPDAAPARGCTNACNKACD
jgi:hypothetical protein